MCYSIICQILEVLSSDLCCQAFHYCKCAQHNKAAKHSVEEMRSALNKAAKHFGSRNALSLIKLPVNFRLELHSALEICQAVHFLFFY